MLSLNLTSVVDPGGGARDNAPSPQPVKMVTERGRLYFMFLGPLSEVSGFRYCTSHSNLGYARYKR